MTGSYAIPFGQLCTPDMHWRRR